MNWSDFVSEVLPDVLGCPDVTIERAVRDSTIEFCDETLCYTVDMDPVTVFANMDVVDLDMPTGARLVQVLRAQIGPRALGRISRDDLFMSGRSWQTDKGMPQAITFDTESSIRLIPAPDQQLSEQLFLRFAVTPSMGSNSIPDAIGNRYFREIVHGAKAALLAIPGQPWFQPQLASAYRSLFDRGIREAKLTVSQDSVAGQKRLRIRRAV
jgi:hypothetical protein